MNYFTAILPVNGEATIVSRHRSVREAYLRLDTLMDRVQATGMELDQLELVVMDAKQRIVAPR